MLTQNQAFFDVDTEGIYTYSSYLPLEFPFYSPLIYPLFSAYYFLGELCAKVHRGQRPPLEQIPRNCPTGTCLYIVYILRSILYIYITYMTVYYNTHNNMYIPAYFRRAELHQGLLGHQPQPPQGRHRVPADISVLLRYECGYVLYDCVHFCLHVVVYEMHALLLHTCI